MIDKLIAQLIRLTESGKVAWQKTDHEDEDMLYVTTSGGLCVYLTTTGIEYGSLMIAPDKEEHARLKFLAKKSARALSEQKTQNLMSMLSEELDKLESN